MNGFAVGDLVHHKTQHPDYLMVVTQILNEKEVEFIRCEFYDKYKSEFVRVNFRATSLIKL